MAYLGQLRSAGEYQGDILSLGLTPTSAVKDSAKIAIASVAFDRGTMIESWTGRPNTPFSSARRVKVANMMELSTYWSSKQSMALSGQSERIGSAARIALRVRVMG